jgi:hypothetical protein
VTADFDLLVVGNETEACLSAVAAARAGARTALVIPPQAMLGGLLTEDGLSFVDRDARHLIPPGDSPHDGLFGQFLARADVKLVALEPATGARALAEMLEASGVTVIRADWQGVVAEGDRLRALVLANGEALSARHFLDATPDGDLAEAAGVRFTFGFHEYGIPKTLGISPLPIVKGVSPERIVETCRQLAEVPELEALRTQVFGERSFLELDHGIDYVLVGPPHLGLAYQRWREAQGIKTPYRFEADGFNVAVTAPDTTSWNGLMYFSEDADTLLRLSREGADAVFKEEALRFERFLQSELGWKDATVELPWGVYVRQTRHALTVRRRLTLEAIARADASDRIGTDRVGTDRIGSFCYYPDFRGFHAPKLPAPLTAPVLMDSGLASNVINLGIASRAGGYTPFAHSLCRLVQYNATLGTALGVSAAMAERDLGKVSVAEVRSELERLAMLADDPEGFARNVPVRMAMQADPVISLESAALATG